MVFTAIRLGLIDQHREWMIRSYVVTTGFVTFRIVNDVLVALDIGGSRPEQRGVAAWLGWAVPLLITEAVLQGRKIRQASR